MTCYLRLHYITIVKYLLFLFFEKLLQWTKKKKKKLWRMIVKSAKNPLDIVVDFSVAFKYFIELHFTMQTSSPVIYY